MINKVGHNFQNWKMTSVGEDGILKMVYPLRKTTWQSLEEINMELLSHNTAILLLGVPKRIEKRYSNRNIDKQL